LLDLKSGRYGGHNRKTPGDASLMQSVAAPLDNPDPHLRSNTAAWT